jgi:hypothetical protein
MSNSNRSSIDGLHAAEGVLSILGQLDGARLPWEERIGLAVSQASAVDYWFAACSRSVDRSRRLRRAIRGGLAQARARATE